MFPWRHIHFTGIGGAGMSALAHLMLQKGIQVTGSDLEVSKALKMLQKCGVEINIGHSDYIAEGIDLLVYSAAVPEDNPELVAARRQHIKVIKRGHFLAEVASYYDKVIAVAGSHGKTTVTSMIAHIFRFCGKNPDYVIGGTPFGDMPAASSGSGECFITEVDESDRSLQLLKSTIGVVINVEDDHSWSTGGKEQLFAAFKLFANRSQRLIYGRGEIANRIFSQHVNREPMDFTTDQIAVPQPGRHNKFNAAIAFKVSQEWGIDSQMALLALQSFQGVSRRCALHCSGDNYILIEDYAHHPTELKCFIDALEETYPNHKKVLMFQPHRFERVEQYGAEFARLLKDFENVFITPPFAAWNKKRDHQTKELANLAGANYFEGCDWEELSRKVVEGVQSLKPVVFAVIGAASIEKVIPYLRNRLRLNEIRQQIPTLKLDVDLSWGDLTTLSIGSYNPIVATPTTIDQLQLLMAYTHRNDIHTLPLGCGSNMVGGDEPFDGIIIRVKDGEFAAIQIDKNRITVGAGVRLSRLINSLAEAEVGGAEALIAIPGSVGGAVRMNAGAQNIETGQFVEEICGIKKNGVSYYARGKDINWWYRGCSIPVGVTITKVVFRFREVDKEVAKEKIDSTRHFRKSTQPGGRNPGCAFQNPGKDSAGRLIERYGMKNLTIGSCTVSDIHANFMINKGDASEEDFATLLETVQKNIFDRCGIVLKNEVIFSTKRKIAAVEPLNVVVLKGGPSLEREISFASGAAVAAAIRDGGHQVVEIEVNDRKLPDLPTAVDIIFPVLHGEFGEDGQLQALLDQTGIPYVGTGAEASKITIDKYRTSDVLKKNGVDTPESQMLHSPDSAVRLTGKWPLVVKPNSQGSTIGMSLVNSEDELLPALNKAFEVDHEVLVEEYVKGLETTVGLINGVALPVVEIIPPNGFFDYDAKYTYAKGATVYNCPPLNIPTAIQQKMQAIAVNCFKACAARDLLRVDMIWQPGTGRIVVLEVNTMPGFTSSSLLPKSAMAEGYSFTELCCTLTNIAYKRRPKA